MILRFFLLLAASVNGWHVTPPSSSFRRPTFAKLNVELLLIDHYDSFTYNLVDYLSQICVKPPTVVAADDQVPDGRYDGIVLSPGPGHPSDASCNLAKSLVDPNIPVLGVCLGHQILGELYGGTVELAPEPVHGQVQDIELLEAAKSDPLWKGIDDISATRYHSLQVLLDSDSDLIPTARCNDVLMAVSHKEYPHFGVQFHPESIGTSIGMQLLRNFCEICERNAPSYIQPAVVRRPEKELQQALPTYRVLVHKVKDLPPNGANLEPVDVMNTMLKNSEYSYWLDAAGESNDEAFSILGASTQRVEYYGQEKDSPGVFVTDESGTKRSRCRDILSYLDEQHQGVVEAQNLQFRETDVVIEPAESVPFDFCGGHVGYLGYEVRFDTDPSHGFPSLVASDDSVPTAAFLWADKSFVYDHTNSDWYLVGVLGHDQDALLDWFRTMTKKLQDGRVEAFASKQGTGERDNVKFLPQRSRQTYNENFESCMGHIRQGDSYELCLTNLLEAQVPGDLRPLDLYDVLRRRNSAPFSAFINWNASRRRRDGGGNLAICCSSPERFLSVRSNGDEMHVEAKPIKGTISRAVPAGAVLTYQEEKLDMLRAQELQESIKDRAENLMIVDLLRNDLARVCEPGSVHVAKLMDIESFATVHQMVSTIRGSLQNSTVDLLRACFPGGSMTGAPKLRSMEILHELEESVARGPYSGCLGYISLNGSMDMNIVIRSAVVTPGGDGQWKTSIGAGGAITALSEKASEYEELMLKGGSVMAAVNEWAGGRQQYPLATKGRPVRNSTQIVVGC